MNEYLLEPFLKQFYLTEAVCGDFLEENEKEQIFKDLAKVFCIENEALLNKYYESSFIEPFAEITDLASYERLSRMIEFAQKNEPGFGISATERMILSQKREAVTVKNNVFKQNRNMTVKKICSMLKDKSENGCIDAMLLLSYMEYHGIFVESDPTRAIRRLRLCAKWNNLFGNLMGIAYDFENRESYFGNLFTTLRGADGKKVFDHVCKAYGYNGKVREDTTAKIIEKAFGLGIINRDIYDTVFAKTAFSALLCAEDKKKLLLTKQKEAIFALSDFPFDVKPCQHPDFDESCVKELPLIRDSEIRGILLNMTVAANCPKEVYKPLMIVAEDAYVNDMYKNLITDGFAEDSLITLDASTLCARDFAGVKENVFLRGLSETGASNTVFLIKRCECLEDESLAEFIKVLSCENRKKFKLFSPAVSIDLSDIRFVLMAGERNGSTNVLSQYCDTVWAGKISNAEKSGVVASIFKARANSFGFANITIDEQCASYLAAYDTRNVAQIVDGAIKCAIYDKLDCVSLATVQSVCKEQNIEIRKRGFGYNGGDHCD